MGEAVKVSAGKRTAKPANRPLKARSQKVSRFTQATHVTTSLYIKDVVNTMYSVQILSLKPYCLMLLQRSEGGGGGGSGDELGDEDEIAREVSASPTDPTARHLSPTDPAARHLSPRPSPSEESVEDVSSGISSSDLTFLDEAFEEEERRSSTQQQRRYG